MPIKWFGTRPIEEYHPSFDRILDQEWSMVKQDFLRTNGYPIERDYAYVRNRYYAEAKANARAAVRALRSFEDSNQ